ncbi:hypothetical protein UCRPA7_2638 [Phaeoacremonium minimum UCRPA7]|uniref:Uncharacterized protein n=1 Tax=Phaeoacremonium minimum (strain UCR-PA7) TaxID=1286976 RepID=R8BR68_PHAM7|nr:hypothetical protein UCRPA7_2638 [Phaeoacremonium minimum UCRPA7]EOO01842.1 hypothetical protein UCRPA7_2638 [Phaeoacremonium minimum UCRPA7]
MAELLGLIPAGLNIASTIVQFAIAIRDGKLSDNRDARKFADYLERLVEALQNLGCLREDADDRITRTFRSEVMSKERRGWATLHKINVTLVPLDNRDKQRRKKVFMNFLTGNAGREVDEANGILVQHILEVKECHRDLNHALVDINRTDSLTNISAITLSQFTSTSTLQQPKFWPLIEDLISGPAADAFQP